LREILLGKESFGRFLKIVHGRRELSPVVIKLAELESTISRAHKVLKLQNKKQITREGQVFTDCQEYVNVRRGQLLII
jgi:hypothetical protein